MSKLLLLTILSIRSANVWESKDSQIWYNGNKVAIRGINWFGLETSDMILNGLWSHDMDFYLDLVVKLGFNALRVPLSEELINQHFNSAPAASLVGSAPSCKNKTTIQVLDLLFQQCAQRGIAIMLDMHRLHKDSQFETWYISGDSTYTVDNFKNAWYTVLDRYHSQPNLMAVDIFNEPHGVASWSGNGVNDWRLFTQTFIQETAQRYPNDAFLFFVEGLDWGKDFTGYATNPFTLSSQLMQRVVFSPHSYGPSVMTVNNYDQTALYAFWHERFGYLHDDLNLTVAVGEWGGKYNFVNDVIWMNDFAVWMVERNMQCNFFWALNPNSGDTAGILNDDWTTVNTVKLRLVEAVVPIVTEFVFQQANMQVEI